jgi:hypothetical protein
MKKEECRMRNLECTDVSALWNDATYRVVESGIKPPQLKSVAPISSVSSSFILHSAFSPNG